MKIYLNLFVAINIAIVNISNVSGQTVLKDSIAQYLEIAAKNNPTVMQRFYEYQAALQKVPQVGALSDPEFTLGVFLSPMELTNGNQVADMRLMQMFPWFGVLKNAKDEMGLMAKAKYESFRDAKLQVFYDVQRTWYELYKTGRDIYISDKNIQILQTFERLTLVRFKTASASGGGALSSGSAQPSQGKSSGSPGMQTMGGNSGATSQASPTPQSNMSPSSGSTGLADLYRIKIEIGDLENNIALLKSQQNTIIARFNSYLNRPPQ
jgi:hypothetical protein